MWLAFAVRLAVAVVLAWSGIGKLLDTSSFRAALTATGLGRLTTVAVVVPAVEIAVAGGLVLGTPASVAVAVTLAAGLFLAFTGWVMAVIRRGASVACGCFGVSRHPVTWRTAVRNIGLLALAGGTLVITRMVDTIALPVSLTGLAVLIGAMLLLALGAAFRVSRPALTLGADDASG